MKEQINLNKHSNNCSIFLKDYAYLINKIGLYLAKQYSCTSNSITDTTQNCDVFSKINIPIQYFSKKQKTSIHLSNKTQIIQIPKQGIIKRYPTVYYPELSLCTTIDSNITFKSSKICGIEMRLDDYKNLEIGDNYILENDSTSPNYLFSLLIILARNAKEEQIEYNIKKDNNLWSIFSYIANPTTIIQGNLDSELYLAILACTLYRLKLTQSIWETELSKQSVEWENSITERDIDNYKTYFSILNSQIKLRDWTGLCCELKKMLLSEKVAGVLRFLPYSGDDNDREIFWPIKSIFSDLLELLKQVNEISGCYDKLMSSIENVSED